MSEDEFELYLRLLGKFLHLKPGQKAEISDELRDHLETRLDELTRGGVGREAAMHRALDEFGDAASLADHFSKIVYERKRRLVMRCTMGTVFASAAALVMISLLGPQGPDGIGPAPHSASAQSQKPAEVAKPTSGESEADRLTREKLARVPTCNLDDAKLGEVLAAIGEQLSVDIFAPRKEFEAELSAKVDFRLKHARPTGGTILELALRQAGLGYTLRDGVVVVGKPESTMEIRVYECAHLGLIESYEFAVGKKLTVGEIDPAQAEPQRGEELSLLELVAQVGEMIGLMIHPDEWEEAGGISRMTMTGTRLVVRTTPEIHREIDSLIQQLAASNTASR